MLMNWRTPMPIDSAGKGLLVGSTVTLTPTITSIEHGGEHAVIKPGAGYHAIYLRQQMSAGLSVGSTPTLTGTVQGFTRGGAACIVLLPDQNRIEVPCVSVTAN
jgi:hypothetical protein